MATIETPASNASEVISADFLRNTNDLTKMRGVRSRYDWAEVKEALWSESFPYQLAVLKAEQRSYKFYEHTIFTLPINPEDLTNAMPFASTVEATLDGVVEQHGGAPFRQIAFSGTFGVLPTRDLGAELGPETDIRGIAGGTLQAVEGLQRQVSQTSGKPEQQANLIDQPKQHGTGYYQYRQFQRFLESYAEAKRTDEGRDLRLALLIWKEQAGYLVTPKLFSVRRSKDSPHEYRYNLTLQAWKRIDPNEIGHGNLSRTFQGLAKPRRAAWAKDVLTRLDGARKVLGDARHVLLAIGSDYDDTVGQALRQTALLLRDTVGLTKTAADFPARMGRHIAQDLEQSWDVVEGSFHRLTDPSHRSRIDSISARAAALKSGAAPSDPSDPIGLRAALSDPSNDWLAEQMKPDQLPLSPATREILAQETERAASLTRSEFVDRRRQALSFIADYANRVGLGSATYDLTMGFSTAQKMRDACDEDYRVLAALNDVAQALGQMAAFGQDFQPRTPTTIEYVAGIANEAGIDMRVPRSKFAVPFPYGGSLERLAQQYLGDSTRWFEIAALNDLRSPYIDEEGARAPLLVNGRSNEVVVADAERLVLGQSVTLSKADLVETTRVVLNTEKVAPGYWVVTLNGAADLDRFTTAQQSQLQFFEQHTVHGGQVIYIPSDQDPTLETPYAPTAADLTRLLQAGDVDGLLTEDGDIALQPDGDWPFVYGLQSIIQWTRTAASTPLGSLALHQGFGFPLIVGQSLADMSAADVLKGLQAMFRDGPAYTGVQSALVEQDGPVTRVSFELSVQGLDALIPISFDLKR